MAQPLRIDWSYDLFGTWKVKMLDDKYVPDNIEMFLDFQKERVLMYNQGNVKEGSWKANEADRLILILSENEMDVWRLIYFDSLHLSIQDTVAKVTLHLERSKSEEFKSKVKGSVKPFGFSDVLGSWILLTIDDKNAPSQMNLQLDISTDSSLTITSSKLKQICNWTFNEDKNKIFLVPDSSKKSFEWILVDADADYLSVMDKGKLLRFLRFKRPLTEFDFDKIYGNWQIVELAGTSLLSQPARFIEFRNKGQLTFFTEDKKEGEGKWGFSKEGDGITIISGGNTESWKVLYYDNSYILLELNTLKMLLGKREK